MTMPAMINGAGKQALNNSGPPVTIYFAKLRSGVAANPLGRPTTGLARAKNGALIWLPGGKINVPGKMVMAETER
jgi:hypothetical protein